MTARVSVNMLIVGMIWALLFSACGGPTAAPTSTLLGTTWTLTAMHGEPPPGDQPLPLSFAPDGRFEGPAPCNAIYGYLDLEHFSDSGAGEFLWSELYITAELCVFGDTQAPAIDAMEQADVYFAALQQSTHYTITGDVLELSNADGNVTLTYARHTGP